MLANVKNVTVLMTEMLKRIASDDHNDGRPDAATWACSVASTHSDAGVLSACSKAGLTAHSGTGEDATVRLTQDGLIHLLDIGYLQYVDGRYDIVGEAL
jgi:hypothetical protein